MCPQAAHGSFAETGEQPAMKTRGVKPRFLTSSSVTHRARARQDLHDAIQSSHALTQRVACNVLTDNVTSTDDSTHHPLPAGHPQAGLALSGMSSECVIKVK